MRSETPIAFMEAEAAPRKGAAALRNSGQLDDARLKRLFREHPEVVVVRAERYLDAAFCPHRFCRIAGVTPVAVHHGERATDVALKAAAFQAYARHLAELAANSPEAWIQLPTVYWSDPDRYGGYCSMPLAAAA